MEIRSEKDLEVLTKIYANSVLLGDESENGWGIKYATEFHMTNDSKLFIGRDKAEVNGFKADEYGRWVNAEGEVLLPLYEGRMVGQFDFSEKGWVSGKGRGAVWREIPWSGKKIEPQFLMRRSDFVSYSSSATGRARTCFMDVTSATNRRTMISAVIPSYPAGNKVPLLSTNQSPAVLSGTLNSTAFDWAIRQRLGATTLNYFIVEETALPKPLAAARALSRPSLPLNYSGVPFVGEFSAATGRGRPVRRQWAITPHERIRLRCIADSIVASLYGLTHEDFAWILRDCDHAAERLGDKSFCRTLDPKGFWRIDKDRDPELRHTVLSFAAFDDLQEVIAAAGSRDTGIEAWCAQNDGDGWMLPETLCIADLALTRTVNVDYDERTRTPQSVRTRMGERLLDWQLDQTPEESLAECERYAKAMAMTAPASAVASLATAVQPQAKAAKARTVKSSTQGSLPGFDG